MALASGSCCSSLVIGNREGRGNGSSLLQYNGLRPLENKQAIAALPSWKPG